MTATRAIAVALIVISTMAAVTIREDTQITLTRSGTTVDRFVSWEACRAEAIRRANAESRTSGTLTFSCQTERRRVVASYSPDPPPPPPGTATLSWEYPAGLGQAGFIVVHGRSPDAMSEAFRVANPALRRHVVEGLPRGAHYFALRAYGDRGLGALSNTVSKAVQ